MPNPRSADQVVSVRLPKGMKEEIMAATGMQFSTFVRTVCNATLTELKRQAVHKTRGLAAREAIPAITTEVLGSATNPEQMEQQDG